MEKFFDRSSSIFFAAILSLFLVMSSPAQSLGQSGDWEKEWKETIQAAKKEGRLVYHAGDSAEPYFNEFGKKYPDFKVKV